MLHCRWCCRSSSIDSNSINDNSTRNSSSGVSGLGGALWHCCLIRCDAMRNNEGVGAGISDPFCSRHTERALCSWPLLPAPGVSLLLLSFVDTTFNEQVRCTFLSEIHHVPARTAPPPPYLLKERVKSQYRQEEQLVSAHLVCWQHELYSSMCPWWLGRWSARLLRSISWVQVSPSAYSYARTFACIKNDY